MLNLLQAYLERNGIWYHRNGAELWLIVNGRAVIVTEDGLTNGLIIAKGNK